jgi:Domain of unknown function (DUF5122) beta-propeller
VAGEGGSSDSNGKVALVRYNSDGSVDKSFGRGGKVTSAIGQASDSTTRPQSYSAGERAALIGCGALLGLLLGGVAGAFLTDWIGLTGSTMPGRASSSWLLRV